MLSRSSLIVFTVVLGASAIVRRQAEDYKGEEGVVIGPSGWDPTIRDKSKACTDMGLQAGASFCVVFDMCCQMGFDPYNGDKCQTIEKSCMGEENAVCILRNCTELVTTTTTTSAPTTAGSANAVFTVSSLLSVVAPFVWFGI